MRELQQELADALKKQCMSQASPELSHYRINLEDEVQDLKTLDQIESQICITYNMSTVHL